MIRCQRNPSQCKMSALHNPKLGRDFWRTLITKVVGQCYVAGQLGTGEKVVPHLEPIVRCVQHTGIREGTYARVDHSESRRNNDHTSVQKTVSDEIRGRLEKFEGPD